MAQMGQLGHQGRDSHQHSSRDNQPITYQALLDNEKKKIEDEKEKIGKKPVVVVAKPQDIEPLKELKSKPSVDEAKKQLFVDMLDHFQVQHDSSFNDFVIYLAKVFLKKMFLCLFRSP